ncbi:MAG: dephospho-CoA kinase [Gammaproteobacteria bacterium]|nr:dephospho-CoA kinase [Gammaproteobacteria bacterium]MYD76308.1 dephospho-CoA kinase [Gammaproteobacteria bacterium]MYJ52754.1 dephospho-CoA kinase [Gammaproteobacteria bacterium]
MEPGQFQFPDSPAVTDDQTTCTVGLTGGVGTGKSTVAKLFRNLGVPVVSADRLARELVTPGSRYLDAIVEAFGPQVLNPDGSLDRPRVAKIVFEDPGRRQTLESILHPPIRELMWAKVETLRDCYCVLEIPLLIETGQWRKVDRVLVVTCNSELRIARLAATRDLGRNDARRIMAAQLDDDERTRHADDIICNEDSLANLAKQVERLHSNYVSLFRA